MLDVLRIMSKVLFAPFWILWKGYLGLWWAFDDSDARRAGVSANLAPPDAPPPPSHHTDAPRYGAEQSTSFEFTNSAPRPVRPPMGPLKGGFVGTLILSSIAAVIGAALSAEHVITPAHAWILWAWGTLTPGVASLYVVRHVARRQAEQQPKTVFGKAKAAAGGVKDAAWGATRGVGRLCLVGVEAGKVACDGVKAAAKSPAAKSARRSIADAWALLRRRAPSAPAAEHPTAAA